MGSYRTFFPLGNEKTDLTKKTKPKKQQEELQDERHETPIIFFFFISYQ